MTRFDKGVSTVSTVSIWGCENLAGYRLQRFLGGFPRQMSVATDFDPCKLLIHMGFHAPTVSTPKGGYLLMATPLQVGWFLTSRVSKNEPTIKTLYLNNKSGASSTEILGDRFTPKTTLKKNQVSTKVGNLC
jgi:hypothetical protein